MGEEETGCGVLNWCHPSRDTAHCRDSVNTAMNRWAP